MKNRKTIFGKGKIGKVFYEFETFFRNRGKSETGGNASFPQGDGCACIGLLVSYQLLFPSVSASLRFLCRQRIIR